MKRKVITARIDEQVFFQIEYLKRHLGDTNTTHILKEAVRHLYNDVKEQEAQKSPFELLEELNLIGCFEGEEDLSINYKNVLSQSLTKKHSSFKPKKKETKLNESK